MDVEASLNEYLPSDTSDVLAQAMRYACLGGGKRIRAALVLGTARLSEQTISQDAVKRAQAAIEMIHAYSLVHDDLPCMDDDDLRRGKPTVHKAFNESIALLVGDGLQAKAFEVLSAADVDAQILIKVLNALSMAAFKMVQGQMIDLSSVGLKLSQAQLAHMHSLKTGAMIESSVMMGAYLAGLDKSACERLLTFAQSIGLAFQVIDDILDATVSTEDLGKTANKDATHDKPTYVSIMGLSAAKDLAEKLYAQAIEALAVFDEKADILRGLADLIVKRTN
ncbi:polyprenyl synthetase family protein [Basilea psittacipulmonis]|uniref:polyprenyl synthetase family protein n=1 Tax=Basilea psittacipulmonis TaxID=1472345 RepID=UPI001F207930|nr:farnesyl diphosphate synthase [Basilea psittacipulmonis]